MSIITELQLEDREPKHQPLSICLDDALKTLNSDHKPRTIPRRYYKQTLRKTTPELDQISPNRGRGYKGCKLLPDKGMVATKGIHVSSEGGIVGLNVLPDKGMVGTKVVKGGQTRFEKEKQIVNERIKNRKEFPSRRLKNTHVQPLGKLCEHRTRYSEDYIPSLKRVDHDASYNREKEKHIQKILNSLNLNTSPCYKQPTISSSKKEPVIKNTSGVDFASSLMESHNLTLKQLREFWQDMPSFLNIEAAKLRRKYGIVGGDHQDDIDDISIEIVTKWNEPTVVLPNIEKQASRALYVVQEEN